MLTSARKRRRQERGGPLTLSETSGRALNPGIRNALEASGSPQRARHAGRRGRRRRAPARCATQA
eukprot:3745628-Heterocapsa_arctica.AAC.1